MTEGPYSQAARSYLAKGWSPIPLPERSKKPPPDGWTGYEGLWASGADVEEWACNGHGSGNVALRLPQQVVGIDVDAYGAKAGAATLASLEARLGPLPATWSCTSRSDGTSSIRVYRVRRLGRKWADTAGPDIEVLHWGHRYMVTAPSVHPDTGRAYAWYGPDGVQCSAPGVEGLPFLPSLWEEELDGGDAADRAAKAGLGDAEALAMLAGYPEGPPCPVLSGLVGKARRDLVGAHSRHDTVRPIVAAAVRAGERGHRGSHEALLEIHDTWVAALQFGERRQPDPGEFSRMIAGAVAIVTADPTDPADIGCCGSAESGGVEFLPPPDALSAFWSSRPELARVLGWARARMVSPWAVLGVVLARAACAMPPQVTLPPLVGGEASLNLFVALVGASGMGKGAAEAVAAEAVLLGEVDTATVGSGEGIGHLYARREKGQVVRTRASVLFTVPEVDNLVALGARQGSTLLPQLRSAWSGERLGFAYADPAKSLPVERHTYRMGLVLGVQPGRAGPLLSDADGGTPQRFLWMPTRDPQAPDEAPPPPEPFRWSRPGPVWPAINGTTRMTLDPSISELVTSSRRDRLRGVGDPLDGHALLCRLKAAAALAVLRSSLDVSADDWALAGTVMAVSDATRAAVAAHLSSSASESNRARGRGDAERADVADEARHELRVARVAKTIARGVARNFGDGGAMLGDLSRMVASRDRDVFEDALEALVRSGKICRASRDGTDTYSVGDK